MINIEMFNSDPLASYPYGNYLDVLPPMPYFTILRRESIRYSMGGSRHKFRWTPWIQSPSNFPSANHVG